MKKTISITFDVERDEYKVNYGDYGITYQELAHVFLAFANESLEAGVIPISDMLRIIADMADTLANEAREDNEEKEEPEEEYGDDIELFA